jgi:hypothetical protein
MFDDLLPIGDFIISDDEVKKISDLRNEPSWTTETPQDLFSSGAPQDLWTTK